MLPNKKGNDAKKFSLLLPNIIKKKKSAEFQFQFPPEKDLITFDSH